jgi:hypothetical protein
MRLPLGIVAVGRPVPVSLGSEIIGLVRIVFLFGLCVPDAFWSSYFFDQWSSWFEES